MKKKLSLILAMCLAFSLVACAKPTDKNPTEPTATKATIQTTPTTTESAKPTEIPELSDTTALTEATLSTEITEATESVVATEPVSEPTTEPATQPTEETKLIGSTPTRKPITVVTLTTAPTTEPTAKPTTQPTTTPITSPTGTLPAGLFVNVPDLPDYDTFASAGTSRYGDVASAQIKVGKVTQEISPNDPRLIRLLNFIEPIDGAVVQWGYASADKIYSIDQMASSILKVKLADTASYREVWIYGDTVLLFSNPDGSDAESARDIRSQPMWPYAYLAFNAGIEKSSVTLDPTRDIWIDFLQYAGFGPEISAAATAPTEPAPTIATVAPGSLAGKTLVIYGLGVNDPEVDYGSYYDEAYKRMIRTAADEWAAMNGVTIRYMGSYDQNTVISHYSSGGACDLVIPSSNMRDLLEIGLAYPFTDAEYNTLAALTGDSRYLDILDRKGQSYGMVLPWSGNMMVYFNQSMFAKYDVKSPLQYYNEGDWTWANFAKCMAEITRDVNGDGTTDIYGLPGDSWVNLVNPEKRDVFTGKLISTIDEPWIQDFIQMKYDAFRVDRSSRSGENNIETNTDSPMYAMQISPCKTYDPQSVFKTAANGDELIAVPLPRWEGENGESKEWVKLTQMSAHIFAGTKEREAVFDLLCYLTKCGMKYMADCSPDTVSCDKDNREYDAAYLSRIQAAIAQTEEWYVYTPYNSYNKYFNYLNCIEIYEKPPAESIPIIKEQYLAALESYNKMYYDK